MLTSILSCIRKLFCHWQTLVGLFGILFVAILVHWLLQTLEPPESDTDAVLFTALLAFMLFGGLALSGKLAEFSAPGGWAMKFKAVAAEPPLPDSLTHFEEHVQFVTGDRTDLEKHFENVNPTNAVGLTLRLGTTVQYQQNALEAYLCGLLSIRHDLIVVFVDSKNTFIGSMPGVQCHAYFCTASDQRSSMFMNLINSKDLPGDIARKLALTEKYLTEADTRSSALKVFACTESPALVVVDSRKQPHCVVLRDRLITNLLRSLTDHVQA